MHLLSKLHQTYENNLDSIGTFESRPFGTGKNVYSRAVVPLLPIFHTTQHSQITLVLDSQGNLLEAKTNAPDDTTTIMPATEKSAGRTSGLCPHPLCDKLQYVAGDFLDFVSEGKTGKPAKSGYTDYVALLSSWAAFNPGNRILQAVLSFVKQGDLIRQIAARFPNVLPVSPESGKILMKWEDNDAPAPPIYKLTAPGTPADALIRWEVQIPGMENGRVWACPELYESWKNFVISQDGKTGLCYVTGQELILAEQHPAKIRNAGDGAKIISSNDQSGFTFRGRFCDASEVCGVGSEITQKAHNALRWLISKQGMCDGSLCIIAWSAGELDVPTPCSNSLDFCDPEEGEKQKQSSDTAEYTARQVAATLKGYHDKLVLPKNRQDIKNRNDILILALDSASPGRLAVTYFNELPPSRYLDNLLHWHTECAWPQHFSTEKIFVGAPAPRDIAEAAYGSNIDEKLRRQTIQRLLPCIIDQIPIPPDLVESCIRRASNKIAMEWWEWEKLLGIACALYKYQNPEQHYSMSLDKTIQDRSYLYGRLLAVAERAENYALFLNGESRSTNAEKLMQRFSERPYSTWEVIEKALNPYRKIIKQRRPPVEHFFQCQLDEIMSAFEMKDYTNDSRLTGAFLLGYHCQRADLLNKEKDPEVSTPNDNN